MNSPEIAGEVARDLIGFFAFAVKINQKVIAVTDQVRSFPLFYAVQEGRLYLGDDPYRIQEKLGGRQVDHLSFAELFLTGYVTGNATFDPRIKQIPAGDVFAAEVDSAGHWEIQRQSYFRFSHHCEYDYTLEELLSLSQQMMDQAVERMIQVANGSTIAVPLSGGYDSRFVLLTLKKIGYANLLAYSYGQPGNAEAEVSRKVAESLKVPWHFVPYTGELWQRWLDSPEYALYQKEGEKMTSVAHVQDWPAVRALKDKRILPEGTLIAPGHSGDYLAGKQIQKSLLEKKGWTHASVAKAIWARHYTNTAFHVALREAGLGRKGKSLLLEKILCNIEGWDVSTLEGANNAYDSEFWQEKLSKFIVNSMRVYEFWGFRWWLPFYDKILVAFWERVPLEFRKDKILYDHTVKKLQSTLNVAPIEYKCRSGGKMVAVFKKSTLLRILDWSIRGRHELRRSFPLAAAFPKKDFNWILRRGGNVNGLIAYLHVKRYMHDAN